MLTSQMSGNTECRFSATREKCFAILWVHKNIKHLTLELLREKRFDEPFLIQEDRSRMKILLLDPNTDLPLHTIKDVLQKAISLYKTGEIKIGN